MVDRYSGRGIFRNTNNMSQCSDNSSCRNARQRDDNGSCGCRRQCSEANECQRIKEKLQKIDFCIIETVLYLDAYPNSCEALKYYHKLKEERRMLAEALSQSCNMPMTNFEHTDTDKWVWVDGPWPWEPAAN